MLISLGSGEEEEEEESGEHNIHHLLYIRSGIFFVDTTCDATECAIGESGEDRPLWIQCECGDWFHQFCVGLYHNITDDFEFQCDYCKNIS